MHTEPPHTPHKIGVIGLTAIGVGTMIGSGWLFSSYYAAKITGAAACLSWITTSVVILLLGLCLAEIATLYPKRGLMARLLTLSHNKEFAFICTISTWLGLTAVIATEAEGSVQYISSLSDSFGPMIFNNQIHQLTSLGLIIAIVMILSFGLINFWGIKILSKSNVALTTCKIAIPLVTGLSVMFAAFHHQNFHNDHAPLLNYGPSSVFIAMIGAGMIYSFNGFQNILSFSSEARQPTRDIPLAIIFSILITLAIYLVLQIAFIGALSPHILEQGWQSLNFTSPFVQLTALLNLNFITIILYADSVISPSGTGLIYTGSTTRLLTAMSQDGQMPRFFNKIGAYNFSRRSLIFTVGFSIIFLLLFRSWSALVSFLSLFYVISYMSIPLSLSKLHQQNLVGKFRAPLPKLLLPVIFAFLSLLFIFSKFPYTGDVALFTVIAYAAYLLSKFKLATDLNHFKKTVKHSSLMVIYIIILAALSSIGPKEYGGYNLLSKLQFFPSVIFVSFIMYRLSLAWIRDKATETQVIKISPTLQRNVSGEMRQNYRFS
ncbi:APC family permease [Piscirickettsia salmonis]|uniref:APC family permease n=1 Tax=Piscirickettsia salmonis TaxID=1238 RepID=UPI0012BAE4BF|nr:APC family permease [Piscirickettsia salmonis]QGP39289.1 L-aspartate transporter [Piscirickettsia salmonis]